MTGVGSHRAEPTPPGSGPGHSHSHAHGDTELEVRPLPRLVLLGVLAAVAVVTVVGVVLLWPDRGEVDRLQGSVGFAAEGTTFPEATVDRVQKACPTPSDGTETDCGQLEVTLAEGPDDGTEVSVGIPPQVAAAGLEEGDRVVLLRTPGADGQPATYGYFEIERSTPLWLVGGLFVLVVVAVARLRGLMALVGLGVAGVVIGGFAVPALLAGESAVPVALVASAAIMFVVLYTTHGLSLRTSAALAGTLAGMVLTAGIGWWAVTSAHLTGVVDEGGQVLSTYAGAVRLQDLLVAAVVIAGLGVLNDVTITQASAVWELRAAAPGLSRARLFTSAMRIGRDHIASTIYTIVFAYAGTSLTLLLAVSLYDRSWLDLLGTEEIAEELVRSFASSIGLVLAVPATTAIAVLTVPGPPDPLEVS
ncbi:YibE/F family protein [Nocardioides anomalus]|uniref:YibE/F family protein n=1 Tax=Nocardioides anomalus TaxID=2712223 RepID=A0A6G6WJ67_9ACTN|nr:YibE/F family protein [Nocardioides anomalus]